LTLDLLTDLPKSCFTRKNLQVLFDSFELDKASVTILDIQQVVFKEQK
jgi:hypothetical protein